MGNVYVQPLRLIPIEDERPPTPPERRVLPEDIVIIAIRSLRLIPCRECTAVLLRRRNLQELVVVLRQYSAAFVEGMFAQQREYGPPFAHVLFRNSSGGHPVGHRVSDDIIDQRLKICGSRRLGVTAVEEE